jgi:hypothetical protein
MDATNEHTNHEAGPERHARRYAIEDADITTRPRLTTVLVHDYESDELGAKSASMAQGCQRRRRDRMHDCVVCIVTTKGLEQVASE